MQSLKDLAAQVLKDLLIMAVIVYVTSYMSHPTAAVSTVADHKWPEHSP